MPTVNPRVNVTLPPSLDDLVSRLARVENASKSHVLRELLEAAEPALRRAVVLMEAAVSASASVRTGLAAALMEQQMGIEAAMSEADELHSDLVDQAQRMSVQRARGGGYSRHTAPAAKPRPPVPVTRGVESKTRAKKGGQRGGL